MCRWVSLAAESGTGIPDRDGRDVARSNGSCGRIPQGGAEGGGEPPALESASPPVMASTVTPRSRALLGTDLAVIVVVGVLVGVGATVWLTGEVAALVFSGRLPSV